MLSRILAGIKGFLPQNFNDLLCLILVGLIFTLWLLDGLKVIALNTEVLGATIAFFVLIGQFYFRKERGEK